jgi:L-asparaginase
MLGESMIKPRVGVASLGGTITMVSARGDETGIRPALRVEDLLSTVPALGDAATLKTETLATLPGASLEPRDLFGALDWARRTVRDGAHGVILVQGTDTIEESAYLLDLLWDQREPLIVTGAMRSPATPGFDGPANLLASVLTVASQQSCDLGVLVVMNDEIHAARRVRKTRSSGVGAFTSPGFGPLGYVEERRVLYGNRVARVQPLPDAATAAAPRVALLETHLGDDGSLVRLVAGAGFDGIIVGGFGVGHVSERMADALSVAVQRGPVVLASRTGDGTTFGTTYGFPGSESDLIARGIIPAGWLDARKARLLLSCLIAAGFDHSGIDEQFALRGGTQPTAGSPALGGMTHAEGQSCR